MGQSKLASGYPDWTVVANQSTSFSSGNWTVSNNSNLLEFAYSGTNAAQMAYDGRFSTYAGLATTGLGLPVIVGHIDQRTGVTTADPSPITLVSSTVAGKLYRSNIRLKATSFTSSPNYTLSWTEGGTKLSASVTVSGTDGGNYNAPTLQPDSGTAITVQLTGTFTATVNVNAFIERIS